MSVKDLEEYMIVELDDRIKDIARISSVSYDMHQNIVEYVRMWLIVSNDTIIETFFL